MIARGRSSNWSRNERKNELSAAGGRCARNHSRNASPTRNVATTRRQSSTLAGAIWRRIMWSLEMDKFVIRSYYFCTALVTDMSDRSRILTMFEEAYPKFGLTKM